jgi:5-methylcytosine-specific restriction endonuclease McrA
LALEGGIPINTKVCYSCKEKLPKECFNASKRAKDGLRGECKACRKQYREVNKESISERKKQHYEANKERISERGKRYSEAHKEQRRRYVETNKESIAKMRKLHRDANRTKIAEWQKMYRKANKVKFSEYRRQYYESNKTKISERFRSWQLNNPDKVRQLNQKRRSGKKTLPSTFTIEEWDIVKEHFNNCCAYCGKEKPLTQDHVYPLFKGGEYTKDNIVPACKSCNSSKRDKLFSEWFPTFRYFSKKRERVINNYLGYKKGAQQLTLV